MLSIPSNGTAHWASEDAEQAHCVSRLLFVGLT